MQKLSFVGGGARCCWVESEYEQYDIYSFVQKYLILFLDENYRSVLFEFNLN